MRKHLCCIIICLIGCVIFSKTSFTSSDIPRAVPTFESIGIYWSPANASQDYVCQVRYRDISLSNWLDGYPLWFDERDGEHRGSIVHLSPATTYEIELQLENTATSTTIISTTWNSHFPIAQTIELPQSSSNTLVIDQSGTSGGYILYTAPSYDSAIIDVEGNADHNIEISASYVIIRGLTLQNARTHGIRLYAGAHDVIIEKNDISGWGRIDNDGWGIDYDSAIYSDNADLTRIIVQGNIIHHPRSDSNNWDEYRQQYCEIDEPCHSRGPQAVTFFNSAGNHVIRFNTVFSDSEHYFNDIIGGGFNFSYAGFPNQDSDIYGNQLSHCWDDAIEAEGANRNVRIWGNFIDRTLVKIATASTASGPLYIWRNVSAIAQRNDIDPWDDMERGGFLKTSDNTPSGGKIYAFHNTILQPPPYGNNQYPLGCSPGLGHGGPMLNVTSRNNILQVYKSWHYSIWDRNEDPLADYDYDLYNGEIFAEFGQEANGMHDVPIYSQTPSYTLTNGSGIFTLDQSSPGYDSGERLANFNDTFLGAGPDIGAHEAGSPAMLFGATNFDTESEIPTTNEWGMTLLYIFLVGTSFWVIRKKQEKKPS